MNDPQARLKLSAWLSLGALAAMLVTGLLFGSWSWPGARIWLAPQAWLRAAATIAALTLALPRMARPQKRPLVSVVLVGLLTLVFFAVRFNAPIGDWQVIAWCAETWQPLGKWYGAALAYGLVHQLIGAPAGLDASTSVALGSAFCGALQAWIAARIAAHLTLDPRFPAWRWLYIGAFGLVAVGLGHREIYSLVTLLTAWVAYRLVLLPEGPQWSRAAQLGLALAAAFSAYVGGLLLVPVWLAALGWWILRARRGLAQRAGALWLAAVPVVLPSLLLALGPAARNKPLGKTWFSQFGVGAAMNAKAFPPFLPADVHWAWFTNFIAPQYWFSEWHLRDLLGVIATSQSLALAWIVLAVVPAWRGARDTRRVQLAMLGLIALPQVCYAALVVHGLPYPWDWDLPAHAFGAATWLALICCAAPGSDSPAPGSRRAVLPAIAAIATCLAGSALLHSTRIPPAEFGASDGTLSLAVGPAPLAGTQGQLVWLWLRNNSTTDVTLSGAEYTVAIVGQRDSRHVRSRLDRHTLIGSRRLRPGEVAPLTSFFWDPVRFEAVDLREDPSGSEWKRIETSTLTGSLSARWLLTLPRGPTEAAAQLVSAPMVWTPLGQ